MIGSRLGPYEITAKLGAGGMGEVYRATDTKLKRDVAIKVLPQEFTADRERLARFEREAQLLAQLHHPNIASIFGMEESTDGGRALVMELVEGPTLAERLEAGPLPFNECLSVSVQIVHALEEAHEKGIVHRDLKPQNIKASREGRVKVLDFGLAKAMDPAGAASGAPSASQLALSPTLTFGATQMGVILGTAAYMSPEQARGLPVDKRADIWAFGVVLYEMLTGRGAFHATTVPDTLAAVLTREIDWNAIPPATPPAIRRLLRRCLERDPRLRLRDIGDARLELGDLADASPPAADVGRRAGRFGLAVAAALAGAVVGGGLALWTSLSRDARPLPARSPVSFQVPPPEGSLFNFSGRDAGPVAFSPDGSRLVFAATDPAGRKRLVVRQLDRLTTDPLAGTEGGTYPFWSPDSRHVGFFADGKLKRIAATGGAVQVLCDAPLGRGGAWNQAGEILFSPHSESPLFRVSASGGAVSQVTTIASGSQVISHRWPSFLPDGRRFLYLSFSTVLSGPESGHAIFVGSLAAPEQRLVLRTNAKAEYVAPGYLLFTRGQNLVAARLDAAALELRGEPVVLAESVKVYPNTGSALFSASQQAGIVFASGASPPISQLVWFDRDGTRIDTAGEPVDSEDPRLSPDGRRIAANRIDPQTGVSNIWIFGGTPATWSRVTFSPTFEHAAIWSPDGERIAFDSFRNPPADIYMKSLAGADETLVVDGDEAAVPTDWSADGRHLIFQRLSATTGWDLWTASPDGERPPAPLLATPFNEQGGQLSPDGRWLAYSSDESGRAEVYVVAFPGPGGKWQVSDAGGIQPRWRRDGRELFYLSADRALVAVGVELSTDFVAGRPNRLFDTRARYTGYRAYDVSPDGQRFLINTVLTEGESSPLTVVLDWPGESLR